MDEVFATAVDQVRPPSTDVSMLYPTIGSPPLVVGAFQTRSTSPSPGEATSPVGAGAPSYGVDETLRLARPVPEPFTALTRNAYT